MLREPRILQENDTDTISSDACRILTKYDMNFRLDMSPENSLRKNYGKQLVDARGQSATFRQVMRKIAPDFTPAYHQYLFAPIHLPLRKTHHGADLAAPFHPGDIQGGTP